MRKNVLAHLGLGAVLLFLLALALGACSQTPVNATSEGFQLKLSSKKLSAPAGGSVSVTLSATSLGGFQGDVSLSLAARSGALPTGIQLSPTSVHVPGGPYTLSVSVAASVPPGDYALSLQGKSGQRSQSVNFDLTVTQANGLQVALDPASLSLKQGGSASTKLTVTPPPGFSGQLALSLTGAGGVPVSDIALNPTTVPVNGPTEVTLAVKAGANAVLGDRSLTVNASSGNLSASTSLGVSVKGFSLSLSSTQVYVAQGEAGGIALSVNAVGVGGDLSLRLQQQDGSSLPAGLSLNPASVTIPGGPYDLTIGVDPAVPTGTYNLRLVGNLNGLEHGVDFKLTVQPPPEFTASLNPSELTIEVGSNDITNLDLNFQQNFNDTITLALELADGSPAPAAFSINPTSLNVAASSGDRQNVGITVEVGNEAEAGTYDLRLRVSSANTTRYVDLTLTVPPPPDFTIELSPSSQTVIKDGSATYRLNVYPHNGYSGTVDLSLTRTDSWPTFNGITFTPSSLDLSGGPVSTTLTLSTNDSADVDVYHFRLEVKDSNTSQSANLALTVEDFSLDLGTSSPAVAFDAGTSGNLALTVNVNTPNRYDTFPNPIVFSLSTQDESPLPSGLTLTPTSTNVSPGSNNLTVAVTAEPDTPGGSYPLRLVATAGGVRRTADFTLNIRSFDMALSADHLAFWTEGSGTVYLTLTPAQGFSGTVDLSLVDANGDPVPGITLSPASVSVSGTTTQTVTISADASAAADVYPLRLKAVSGSIVKYANLTLSVEDFGVTLDTTAISLWQGNSTDVSLTVTPKGGFAGGVSLVLESQPGSTPPAGITLSPQSVSVLEETTESLAISASGDSSLGQFNMEIRASATLNGVTRERTLPLALTLMGMNVSMDGAMLGVAQGGSRTFPVTIESYGVNGEVTLTLEGANGDTLPTGITLSPTTLTVTDGTRSYDLTIDTDSTVPYGNPQIYPLDIAFKNGVVVKKSSTDLAVYRIAAYWLGRESGTSSNLLDVTYGEPDGTPAFVAVGGDTGTVVYSSDGLLWQGATSSQVQNNLQAVGYGNGYFVAVGSACEITRSDDRGQSWVLRAAARSDCPAAGLTGVAYGEGTFVAVGGGGWIERSTDDGFSWSQVAPYGNDPANDLTGVAYGNGTFVAVGKGGTILASTDGQNWSLATSPTADDLTGVTYGNGTFVAVGKGGTVLTSSNGQNWVSVNSGITNDLTGVTHGYDWDGTDIFVATTLASNVIYVLYDGGASWSEKNNGAVSGLLGIAYGNHRFVAVGTSGILVTSP